MAYNNANLNLTAGVQQDGGPYCWVYTTSDSSTDVEDGGYFNGAFGRIRYGDVIRVVASDTEKLYRVTGAQHPSTVSVNPIETL